MANRVRNKCVNIRVSERELLLIKKKVFQSKLSLREYVVRCLLGKEILVKEGGLEVVKELKAIGNNVNQVAHGVNAKETRDYTNELVKIYEALKGLMQEWQ